MLLLLVLILSSGGYTIYKIYIDHVDVCTKQPLVYASNKWLREYGLPLEGEILFIDAKNKTFYVMFNSSSQGIRSSSTPRIVNDPYSGFVSINELILNYNKS